MPRLGRSMRTRRYQERFKRSTVRFFEGPMASGSIRTCHWCGISVSSQQLVNHGATRACFAGGHALRARDAGLVRIGSLTANVDWRLPAWGPVLLRARAPYAVLPTRAKRFGNTWSRDRGWLDPREVWIPKWMNLLFATQPSGLDRELQSLAPLVQFLRWSGKGENARALAAFYTIRGVEPHTKLGAARQGLFEVFLAANPGIILWEELTSKKRDSVYLQYFE